MKIPFLQSLLHPIYKDNDPLRQWKMTAFHQLVTVMLFLICIPMAIFVFYAGAYSFLVYPLAVFVLLLPVYPFLAHGKLAYAVTLFELLSIGANIIAMQGFGLNDPGYFAFFNTLIAGLFLSSKVSFVWSAIFTAAYLCIAWLSPAFTLLPWVDRSGAATTIINTGHHVSSMIIPLWSGSVVSIFFERYVRKVTHSMRETNRQLDEALEFSDRIINQAGDGIVVLDGSSQILLWNPAMEKLSGLVEKNVLGREIFSAATGFNTTVLSEHITQAKNGHATRINSLEFIISDNPDPHWCSADFTPNRRTDGTIEGVVILLRDLTDQRQIEDSLRQSQKMEAVGQLAGGIAHDFNNQLAAISGYAGLLSNKIQTDDQMRTWIDRIVKGTQRSSDIIGKLLTFARKNKQTIALIDVHDIITEVCDMLEHSIERITVVKRLSASPSYIQGDASMLQNSLLNLGINARDAMPKGGNLTFTTQIFSAGLLDTRVITNRLESGEYIMIQVSDTGTGIPAHIRTRIFDPFFTTKEAGKGTGMGLAVVYGTIQEHKGTIKVDSVIDQGTTFTILLPLRVSKEKPIAADVITAQPSGSPAFLNGKRILFVDDEASIRELGHETLSAVGCIVKTAIDGIDATWAFNQEPFDLVVLDMLMPRMNGMDTLHVIRSVNPTIPILLVSGYNSNQTAIDERTAFMGKPFTAMGLAEVATQLIRKGTGS